MSNRYIAAIAGSAGSQAALEQFFDHTPHDDVSFVVLRHMPEFFESRMAFILSRHSDLGITEIRHGMVLKTDTIYVAPAGKYVTIEKNIFSISQKTGAIH